MNKNALMISPATLASAAVLLCFTTVTTAATPACDRACLQGFVGDYAIALIKHDPSGLRVSPNVKVSEDSAEVKLGAGPSWKGITGFKSQPQYVSDIQAQEVAYMGVVDDAGKPAFLALRLKIANNQIIEIESVLTHDGEGGPAFEPEGMMYREAPYIRDVPAKVRSTRATLLQVANTFWDVSTSTHDASKVPYAMDCWHFENGMNTNWERFFNPNEIERLSRPEYQPQAADGRIWTCARETILTTSAWKAARQRHFVMDEERGLILTITNVDYPGRGMPAAPGPTATPQVVGAPGAGGPPQAAGSPPAGGPPGGSAARNPIEAGGNAPVGMSAKGMQAAMAGGGYVVSHFMLMRIVDGKIAREQDVMRVVPTGTNRIF
jgi:hypothetical protein